MVDMQTVLVTGGAGFIGSHLARHLLRRGYRVIVLDALTYAGNRANLADISSDSNFEFIHADIRDQDAVETAMSKSSLVAHLAAETHNDRAILDSGEFISTDVFGTFVMLDAARRHNIERFLHVSTDEVYGSIVEGEFSEQSNIAPNMPYAASKAGGELMARAYFKTHKLPTVIARPSNNFGPNQYPEKMMPLFITNAIDDKPLPLYGDGRQVRDWLYVEDNCSALEHLLRVGRPGEAYNIGANCEQVNVEVTHQILNILGKPLSLVKHVEDRPGHDVRYALDASKLRATGWKPEHHFAEALETTVNWYVNNEAWWRSIKENQAEFAAFTTQWYRNR